MDKTGRLSWIPKSTFPAPQLDTEIDVSGASVKRIDITKPGGAVLTIAASVVDTTKLNADVTAVQTDEVGNYLCETYAQIGAAIYIGETFLQEVLARYT